MHQRLCLYARLFVILLWLVVLVTMPAFGYPITMLILMSMDSDSLNRDLHLPFIFSPGLFLGWRLSSSIVLIYFSCCSYFSYRFHFPPFLWGPHTKHCGFCHSLRNCDTPRHCKPESSYTDEDLTKCTFIYVQIFPRVIYLFLSLTFFIHTIADPFSLSLALPNLWIPTMRTFSRNSYPEIEMAFSSTSFFFQSCAICRPKSDTSCITVQPLWLYLTFSLSNHRLFSHRIINLSVWPPLLPGYVISPSFLSHPLLLSILYYPTLWW